MNAGARAPLIKFCGLTRAEDARAAVAAGGAYLGVIFAGGPRLLTPGRAREVLWGLGAIRRVGVFGSQPPALIGEYVREVGLDVVQMHGDPDAAAVAAVRQHVDVEVWAALRVGGELLPAHAGSLYEVADAVVLDALVPGAMGGTGRVIPWGALRAPLDRLRSAGRARTVLAGGLSPHNVASAIDALAPEIVDVSSGVEWSPGIKDPALLLAFAEAVRTSNRET